MYCSAINKKEIKYYYGLVWDLGLGLSVYEFMLLFFVHLLKISR
jgi:hypothetical protein